MSDPIDAIWVCQAGAAVAVRVEGKGTVQVSPAILRFIETRLSEGVTTLAMDLGGCTHMDSTFLGTLISLHRAAGKSPGGRFTITALSSQCADILHHNALDRVLHIAAGEAPLDGPWSALPSRAPTAELFKRNVVQAHQELAALPGEAGAPYRKVAARLSEEMKGASEHTP
jgi:anti-anti-sigma factor